MDATGLFEAVLHRLVEVDAGALRRATWAVVDDVAEIASRLAAGDDPSPLVVAAGPATGARAAVPAWAEPLWNGPAVVRIGVAGGGDDAADSSGGMSSAALSAAAGRPLAVHRTIRAHRRGWGWPLRIGVRSERAAALLAEIESLAYLRPLFVAAEVVAGAAEAVDVDVLIVERDDLPFEHGAMVANAVFVLGAGTVTRETLGFCTGWLGAAAVVAVPSSDVTWFEDLLRGLSHNQPFDVAVGGAIGDALLYADTSWLALTSLRELAARWRNSILPSAVDVALDVPDSLHRCGVSADQLLIDQLADAMVELTGRQSYSSEMELATAQADVSTAAAARGQTGMRLVDQDVEAAPEEPVAEEPVAEEPGPLDHLDLDAIRDLDVIREIQIDLDDIDWLVRDDTSVVWGGGGGGGGEEDMAEPPMVDERPPLGGDLDHSPPPSHPRRRLPGAGRPMGR
ncbi:MAG: hypothetical protein WCC60_04120, partial [Ilumatobacteraceae bacterium]